MAEDGTTPLRGNVQVDETSIGGKSCKHLNRKAAMQPRERHRTTVDRRRSPRGRGRAIVIPSCRGEGLRKHAKVLRKQSECGSIPMASFIPTSGPPTTSWAGTSPPIVGSTTVFYVDGDIHTVEGFFGNLKTGIEGTTSGCPGARPQGYLN
jgi:hypothetical protein